MEGVFSQRQGVSQDPPVTHPSHIDGIHHIFSELGGDPIGVVSFSPIVYGLTAAGTGSGTVALADASHLPPLLHESPVGHAAAVSALHWSQGNLLLSVGLDGEAIVWFIEV